jgi:hypothetical protein
MRETFVLPSLAEMVISGRTSVKDLMRTCGKIERYARPKKHDSQTNECSYVMDASRHQEVGVEQMQPR